MAQKMEFSYKGRMTCLKVLTSTCNSLIDDKEISRISRMEHMKGLLLQLISRGTQEPIANGCEVVSELLGHFSKVFEEPRGLPPQRSHDHQMPWKDETLSVNVRLYRCPYYKKN